MRLVEKIKQWKAMPAEKRSAKASAVLKNAAKYFFAKNMAVMAVRNCTI